MDEARVKRQICAYLKSLQNCHWERRNAVGLNYKKGIPDLWCVHNGKHYEIEVKDIHGTTSVMQDKYRRILQDAGCIYILAMKVEDVKNIIKEEI